MSTSDNITARIKSLVWVIPNSDIVKGKFLKIDFQSERFPEGPRPRGTWIAKLEMIMHKPDVAIEVYNHVLRLCAVSERRAGLLEADYKVEIYTRRRSNQTRQFEICSFTGKAAIEGDTLRFELLLDEMKVVEQITRFGNPDLCVAIEITEKMKSFKRPQSPSTPARNTRNTPGAGGKKRGLNGTILL